MSADNSNPFQLSETESLQQASFCQSKYQRKMQLKMSWCPQVAVEPQQLNSGEVQNYRESQEQKNEEKPMEKLDEKERILYDWQKQLLQHEDTKFLKGQCQLPQQQKDLNLQSLWNQISKWETILQDLDVVTDSAEDEDDHIWISSGLESGLESSLESGLESELESGLESDVDSDLESDVESGLVYETSSKVINHQLEKLKEASKELQTEVEVLLRDKKEFKNHLQQQLWENLPLFVAMDANVFLELKDHQWTQSWHTWDGDLETLRQHLTLWESTFAYEEREKLEQLGLTPINEVTEDDEEDKNNEMEEEEEEEDEEEEEEIGECEEDESEMEFNVPQSHQSSTCLQSLSSEGSSSSTEEDSSDTDASASTTSATSRYSGQDQEENTYNSKDNKDKYRFQKMFGWKETRRPAASRSNHRGNEEASQPLINRMQPMLDQDRSAARSGLSTGMDTSGSGPITSTTTAQGRDVGYLSQLFCCCHGWAENVDKGTENKLKRWVKDTAGLEAVRDSELPLSKRLASLFLALFPCLKKKEEVDVTL